MSNLVFLDVETVSLTAAPGSVWEIAAVERTPEGDREWLWQVRPDLSFADPNALRIGKFYKRFKNYNAAEIQSPYRHDEGDTDERPGYARTTQPEIVASHLARMLDGATLVGACPWFDAAHLEAFLRAHGQAPSWHHRLCDVEALAAGRLRRKVNGLNDAAKAFGFDWDYDAAHTALYDAQAARFVYDAVMTGADPAPGTGDVDGGAS